GAQRLGARRVRCAPAEGGPPPPGSEAGSAERSCVQSARASFGATQRVSPILLWISVLSSKPQRSATCASSGAAWTGAQRRRRTLLYVLAREPRTEARGAR